MELLVKNIFTLFLKMEDGNVFIEKNKKINGNV
jgi:hypothetical protein